MNLHQPLKDLFKSSQLLVLDFSQIPSETPVDESMQQYFETASDKGINPRLPENRQKFNNRLIDKHGIRYLYSRYAEDRKSMLTGSSIAKEGRTLHLGVDVFSKELETVYAPCDAVVKRVGHEPEDHSFGYFIILEPTEPLGVYVFLGHLSSQHLPIEGTHVVSGQAIAQIGDFPTGENGGWSRHLHIQMLKELPAEGQAPIGYSSHDNLAVNRQLFPDPMPYFTDWRL